MGMGLGDDTTINFLLGEEQVDRLYLGTAFVWPNYPITDFAASDNLVKELHFTWTDPNVVLPHSYDLYENGIRIYDNLVSGQTLEAIDGTADYYIRGLYEGGHYIQSNTDSGTALDGIPPSVITDFSASDETIFQKVECTWSDATGDPTPTYDIYVDDEILDADVTSPYTRETPSGSADYYVMAINFKDSVKSNVNQGTPIEGYPPSDIDDFEATDDQELNVQCFWTHDSDAYPLAAYDLYVDGSELYENVVSGVSHGRAAGTSDYHVIARNKHGEVESNHNSGTALEEYIPPPTCDPGSTYFNVPGVYGAIVPSGVTNIDVCMVAGGGSGSSGPLPSYSAGGGYAGQEFTGNIDVTPEGTVTITVGAGGSSVGGGGISDSGNPGGNSGVGSTVVSGGSGGQLHQAAYPGTGGPGPSGCGGGGTRDGGHLDLGNYVIYGGQASSFGNGGQGGLPYPVDLLPIVGPGGTGAGGGAVEKDSGGVGNSGAGGAGYVGISWDCAIVADSPVYKLSEMTEEEMKRRQIQPLQDDGITLMTYEEWDNKRKEL